MLTQQDINAARLLERKGYVMTNGCASLEVGALCGRLLREALAAQERESLVKLELTREAERL